MVGADVELPVLEHDELAAVPALLCPAAAVALVLRQAALRSGFQDSEHYRGGGAQRLFCVLRSLKRRVRAARLKLTSSDQIFFFCCTNCGFELGGGGCRGEGSTPCSSVQAIPSD